VIFNFPSSNLPQKPIRGLSIRSRLAKRRSTVVFLIIQNIILIFPSSNLMQNQSEDLVIAAG
jgi:hypothetical protein